MCGIEKGLSVAAEASAAASNNQRSSSRSPRPLPENANAVTTNLRRIGLNAAASAAASRPPLNNAQPFNLLLTTEELAQQLAIQANLNRSAARAASSSSSAANRPLGLGNSAASAIPLNGLNIPAQAASNSSVNQLVSNASRNLAGVVLNQQSELKAQIEKLKYQIPILITQIAKLEKSDPKG